MAGKTVSFNTHCNLYECQLESIAKWLSCNGEVWGMGPTMVFASAAALFLYNELQATVFTPGDHARVSLLEKTLISTMIVGMLSLMVHLWVCSMRFFQYYLDTLIKDSPSMLLELTTAGLLGQTEIVPLGPLTRFLKQQQPQIHITVCWFLSLCYADYVRKHYCRRFNMPYLEQWQAELHERVSRGVRSTVEKVNSVVCAAHRRLRNYTEPTPPPTDEHTESVCSKRPSLEGAPACGSRCTRVVRAGASTADAIEKLRTFIALVEWTKCGESYLSTVPTLLWALGSAALAHRLISAMFRRFMFRRVPLWEIVLQNLLFLWMIIYSLHFWTVVSNVVKFFVEYCFETNEGFVPLDEVESCKIMQRWMVWMCSTVPLVCYVYTRPKAVAPPLMIWITTNPWHRREMGAYGYYLNRPISYIQPTRNESLCGKAPALRRAFSDSKTVIKEPPKKRRNSKSI